MAGSYKKGSAAKTPALGLRALALVLLSVLLMFLDQRDGHLDAVR